MDDRSWDEFSSTYSPYICAILYKSGVNDSTIDDLKQNIMVKIWKSIENFEYNPDKCKFRTWLSTVCRNVIYNHFRDRKVSVPYLEDTSADAKDAEIDAMMEQEWKIYIASKALENVTDRLGEATMKSYRLFYEGMKAPEIAKELNIQENTVYVHCKRVKEAMAREIILLTNDLE